MYLRRWSSNETPSEYLGLAILAIVMGLIISAMVYLVYVPKTISLRIEGFYWQHTVTVQEYTWATESNQELTSHEVPLSPRWITTSLIETQGRDRENPAPYWEDPPPLQCGGDVTELGCQRETRFGEYYITFTNGEEIFSFTYKLDDWKHADPLANYRMLMGRQGPITYPQPVHTE